jgi:hypothetical protein
MYFPCALTARSMLTCNKDGATLVWNSGHWIIDLIDQSVLYIQTVPSPRFTTCVHRHCALIAALTLHRRQRDASKAAQAGKPLLHCPGNLVLAAEWLSRRSGAVTFGYSTDYVCKDGGGWTR